MNIKNTLVLRVKKILKARNGRRLKVGSHVKDQLGDRCFIYDIGDNGWIGLERCCDGISWSVQPSTFNGRFV